MSSSPVTIGTREQESGEVSVRTLDGKVTVLPIDAFIERCTALVRRFSKETVF